MQLGTLNHAPSADTGDRYGGQILQYEHALHSSHACAGYRYELILW